MTTPRILSLGLAAAVLAAAHPASAQTITNFSFESNSAIGSGYGAINGWTAIGGGTIGGGSHGVGLNNSSGPFANNGVIPDGTQVAFLQTNGSADTTLAQTINGLTIGDQYVISFYDNSRAGFTAPTLNVSFGGQAIAAPQTVNSVGGTNPYHFITGTAYTATGTSAALLFAASLSAGGDSTALIDNVTIKDISPGAPVPEASTTVSLGLLLALGFGGLVVARRKKAAH